MKRLAIFSAAFLAVCSLAASPVSAQVLLNEIRVDHQGTDVDEYIELVGPAGLSLAGYTVVVIGDGTGTCGTIENVIDLSAYSIQADGFFALRVSSGVAFLTGYDATQAGSFENSDNLTFLLVTGWTGGVPGADLDATNDGVLDSAPWTTLADEVGIYEGLPINCAGGDEYLYTTVAVGPDGTFSPGHIYRCGALWNIGPFGATPWPSVDRQDTPGALNSNCPTPAHSPTWGKIKVLYR